MSHSVYFSILSFIETILKFKTFNVKVKCHTNCKHMFSVHSNRLSSLFYAGASERSSVKTVKGFSHNHLLNLGHVLSADVIRLCEFCHYFNK